MRITTRKIILLFLMIPGACLIINSCTHAPYVMPVSQRTGDPYICFERDILPIFISNCTKSGCHNAESHASGYTLDSYKNIMKKGIVPGNVAASRIWESVARKSFGVSAMPANAGPLSATDLDLLRRWIQTGAIDSGGACSIVTCDSSNFTYAGVIAPLMHRYCTGCHNSASAQGGSLLDYNSVKTASVNGRLIGNITHQAGYVPMPPTGITLIINRYQ